jgi:hypothetical protein
VLWVGLASLFGFGFVDSATGRSIRGTAGRKVRLKGNRSIQNDSNIYGAQLEVVGVIWSRKGRQTVARTATVSEI